MKNKRNVLFILIIMLLAGVIYFPPQAQQKHDAKTVIYQPDVKKSKLFWQAPQNHFTTGNPTRGT